MLILFLLALFSTSFSAFIPPPPATGEILNQRAQEEKDARITKAIRELIVSNTSLPKETQKIVIQTSGGIVTLSGVVATQSESHALERAAKDIAGTSSVINKLEAKEPKAD